MERKCRLAGVGSRGGPVLGFIPERAAQTEMGFRKLTGSRLPGNFLRSDAKNRKREQEDRGLSNDVP